MKQNPYGLRNFKDGAWDLRKVDRRKMGIAIRFPDRRLDDRRLVSSQESEHASTSNLVWISPSGRDE